jgi:murein DD-endopeptidase MepM/ murein hydrolase activator NlpD
VSQTVPTKHVASLLALAFVLFAAAVAVAGGAAPAPRTNAATPALDTLLERRTLQRDMRGFARRLRARRLRARMRAGVVPVRGPVDYGTGTNGFGAGRGRHVHNGQDMFAPTGTPLVAAGDGVVLETGSDGGRGNYVILHSPARRLTFSYFHMDRPAAVKPGTRVKAGQRVGSLGCSGSCDGAHLHFEVHRGRGARGRGIDPMRLLKHWHRLPFPIRKA